MTTQPHASPTTATPAARPMTGEEYIESLRDGREVFIYGDKVADVTTHPAFRNAARITARLYDSLHDPARQDVVTAPTDTGNGGFTHPFFRTPRSAADLYKDRDAIAEWARMTYGWMGRSPARRAAFQGTGGAQSECGAKVTQQPPSWFVDSKLKVRNRRRTAI